MRKNFVPHREWKDLKENTLNNLCTMKSTLTLDEKISEKYAEYQDKKVKLSHADDDNYFDASERKIGLTYNEKLLDNMLNTERKHFIKNKHTYFDYPSANMFYKVRKNIENTVTYKIMQKLPKGGNLHIHTSSSWDASEFLNFLKNEFKYSENVYIYQGQTISSSGNKKPDFINGQLLYLTDRKLISEFNQKNQNGKLVHISRVDIDEEIKLITFSDPNAIDKVDYIWDEFSNVFARVYALLSVKKVYKEYYYHTFETLYADNIDYCELRFGLTKLCESNDDKLSAATRSACNSETKCSDELEVDESIDLIYDLYKLFQQLHPDFKLKLIISTSRSSNPDDNTKVLNLMQKAQIWRENFKDDGNDFIIGFDFVSEEDLNYKTDDYAKVILENDIDIPFYFHDGESNWADDDNVIAAVCLNTKRIGHGFNLYRFPAVLEEVVKRDICLEICPISNQLLRYSPDLRSHPMGEYIKRGIPFVIASDDPQIFNDKGLSYDFWEFYYSQLVDLVSIKQVIRNSYTYSAMSEAEKKEAVRNWEQKWYKTVADIVENSILCCAVMLEECCNNEDSADNSFVLNEDDMNIWQNHYIKLLRDKNICSELVDKSISGTISREEVKTIIDNIYKNLIVESAVDEINSNSESDISDNVNCCFDINESHETSYAQSKTEYFNLAWE